MTSAPPSALSPVILSLLAPADRCNQSCPACYLTEVTNEPVRSFDLRPDDFALFVEQFIARGVPVRAVSFQGYEVTLPRSWSYVEAAFTLANDHSVPTSFITNGMLLWKHTDSVDALDPTAITVSLDGATAGVNDRLRGLSGAFEAARHGMRRFLRRLPRFAERMSVASTLYDETNVGSLSAMPRLLRELGIPRWQLGFELVAPDGRCVPAQPKATLVRWLERLHSAATDAGVHFDLVDEFGALRDVNTGSLPIRRLFDPEELYRLDPTGTIRSGPAILEVWNPAVGRRWNPRTEDAVEVSGYADRLLQAP